MDTKFDCFLFSCFVFVSVCAASTLRHWPYEDLQNRTNIVINEIKRYDQKTLAQLRLMSPNVDQLVYDHVNTLRTLLEQTEREYLTMFHNGSMQQPSRDHTVNIFTALGILGQMSFKTMIPAQTKRTLVFGSLNMTIQRVPKRFSGFGSGFTTDKSSNVTPSGILLSNDVITPDFAGLITIGISSLNRAVPRTDSLLKPRTEIFSVLAVDSGGERLSLQTGHAAQSVTLYLALSGVIKERTHQMCTYLQHGEVMTRSSKWRSEGCTWIANLPHHIVCKCNHLGTFIAMEETDKLPDLSMITWISCITTTAFCIMTTVVIIGYRLTKSLRAYIRMMFLLLLASAETTFFGGWNYAHIPGICTIIAAWLHFSCMACFAWLMCYVIYLGNEFRGKEQYYTMGMQHYNAIGWLLPLMMVVITIIFHHDDYRRMDMCWITNRNLVDWSLKAPAIIMMAISLIVLAAVLHIYIHEKSQQKKVLVKVTMSGIRACFFLLPMLGVTWVLGAYLIEFRTVLLEIIFMFCNTMLGIFVFTFMCYFNEELRMTRLGRFMSENEKIMQERNEKIRKQMEKTGENLRAMNEQNLRRMKEMNERNLQRMKEMNDRNLERMKLKKKKDPNKETPVKSVSDGASTSSNTPREQTIVEEQEFNEVRVKKNSNKVRPAKGTGSKERLTDSHM